MSITLTIDPSATPLSLHDRANGWRLVEFDPGNPDPETQWASSADTEGALAASSRPLNRTIAARVIIEKSTAALLQTAENTLGMKIGKLMREQGTLQLGYPSGDTITFDVLEARLKRSITPQFMYRNLAEYELQFVCKPYGYGAEVDLGDNTETTLPALIFTEASVAGDVPALGRLVVDNDVSTDQWWLTWGIQSRYYSSSANAALFYEAESRTPLGSAATAVGPTGASGGGSNVISHTSIRTQYQAIMSTQASGAGAHLSHVGTFRVYARVYADGLITESVTVALEWAEGEFVRTTVNEPVTLLTGYQDRWVLLDLGLVSLRAVVSGTQRWEGRVLAKAGEFAGGTIHVDYLFLVPVDEGSGVVSAITSDVTPASYSVIDQFSNTTSGAVLHGRVPSVGTTAWATSGAANDFTFIDAAASTNTTEAVTRTDSSSSFRYAVCGPVMTGVTLSATVAVPSSFGACGLVARWVDASNHLRLSVNHPGGGGVGDARLQKIVAGTPTTLGVAYVDTRDTTLLLKVTAHTNGAVTAAVSDSTGNVLAEFDVSDSVLATGGTLDDGQCGLVDSGNGSGATTRWYDDVIAYVPVKDAAIFASQSLEIRHDRIVREDSAGALWTNATFYRGDYLQVPPSGAEARTARFIVKFTRGFPSSSDPAIDDISARLFVTPRYLVVPE